jgi:hypothetical protein
MVASPSDVSNLVDDADDVAECWNLVRRTAQDRIHTTISPVEALERIPRVLQEIEGDNRFYITLHRKESPQGWLVLLAHPNSVSLSEQVRERYAPCMKGAHSESLEDAIEVLFNNLVKSVELQVTEAAAEIELAEKALHRVREKAHYLGVVRRRMGAFDRNQQALSFESASDGVKVDS